MGQQYKKLVKKIPRELRARYGFTTHMSGRPNGVPRHQWVRIWMDQHGENWPIRDRIELGKLTPPVGRVPSVTPRVKHAVQHAGRKQHVQSEEFLRSGEWRRLRMLVIKKRGARCECCGATPKDGVTVINVDHIKPRRDFPELALSESNLQVLCAVCNHGKGNWDKTDWRDVESHVVIAPDGSVELMRPRLLARSVI